MGTPNPTRIGYGTLTGAQSTGTAVCTIPDLGKGRWKIWGTVRHHLADGCRLFLPPPLATVLFIIPSGAGQSETFGPIVYDVSDRTQDLVIDLSTALGGGEIATAVVYAELTSLL